jgi:hypothetical protein
MLNVFHRDGATIRHFWARSSFTVPVAPTPPQKLGAAHVEGGGDEDAHASAHDLIERRQQRLALGAGERVDQDRLLPVAQRIRRHRRRDAVPDGRPAPESGGDLVECGHDTIIALTLCSGSASYAAV